MRLTDGLSWDFDITRAPGEIDALARRVWPRYLLEPGDLDDASDRIPSPVPTRATSEFYFGWGVRESGRLVAAATAVSLRAPFDSSHLSDDGWRFATAACAETGSHDSLCLLSASIAPEARGRGISRALLRMGKRRAKELGMRQLIAPVRPSRKEFHPAESMRDYLSRKNSDGVTLDPWLRTHVELGARILNVCERSIIVRATRARWEDWLSRKLPEGGKIAVPRGLVPMELDLERDRGSYIEPNVWVRYSKLEGEDRDSSEPGVYAATVPGLA